MNTDATSNSGTQVLQQGQTSPELEIVSLAGRSGFSSTANVHGFAFSSGGQTKTKPATRTQTQTITPSVAAGAPAPGDPGGSKTVTAVEDDKKKKKEDEKARKGEAKGWRFSKLNPFSGRAPSPGDPDGGGGGGSPREGKGKGKKEANSRAVEEKEGGCFGCLRLFKRKKQDPEM